MRLAFMGAASFAVPALAALVGAGHRVDTVFTQPDRPAGRGRKPHASPVKEAALALGLEISQPESLKTEEVGPLVERLAPDMIVVVAYGKIVPPWLLDRPPRGVVNVHGSLLPRYRGAAPVAWAIARGEERTGVCTMRLDPGLDTGPVYSCVETAIGPEETTPEVTARLAELGAGLLVETLAGIESGAIRPTPQDDSKATLAPSLRRQDGYIRWEEESSTDLHNKVRAFVPWPSVTVHFRGKACRILRTRPTGERDPSRPPGGIVFDGKRLMVTCSDHGLLEILSLQLQDRKALSGADFGRGMHVGEGDVFAQWETEA